MSCCPIGWRLVARSVAVSALISLFSVVMIPLSAADLAPWADVAESEEQSLALGVAAERPIVPQRYRTVRLDWAALGGILPLAPRERTPAARSVETVLNLPLPDGTFGRFRIEDSPMMDASLAAALPDVKTYRGFGLDDPSAFARFDTTPAGFHAMIRSNSATIFIDPYARGERDVYIVYDKRDFVVPESERPVCLVDSSEGALLPPILPVAKSAAMPVAAATNGATFRQINLAVAATGEYTTFHGGTVPLAQAAIVTTINRVNVVYEHDLAIRMNLVDNSTVVFTNSATDPYSNVCSVGELGVNQTTLDTNIGATFYDLGHVMGGPGGGGGRAGVGPCLQGIPGGNLHARGCTGLDTPIGDPFDIDFVAHEIGHQWGAPHTFNGTVGNCAGNRVSSAAYEPGSCSTIMAYAGICGSDNLQSNSDDYFHGSSLETIAGYDPTAFGAAQCIQMTASGNTPPAADAGVGRNIPNNTPFTLCGSGTDPDVGDNLTYLWEEYDLGPDPGGPPNSSSKAPFFRSFDPTADNCRTFPKLSDILSNSQTNGEILPNVFWIMKFRLTAFDNHSGGVGGAFDQDETNIVVEPASGPFQITSPNTSGIWNGGAMQSVTWYVGLTNQVPINCSNVDILFSYDGGVTFPIVALANTPNDGSETFLVPDIVTGAARLKVRCSDNVFFDINNDNSTVFVSGCNADAYEPDADSGQAKVITPGTPKNHSICPVGDSDWSTFTLSSASAVTLATWGPIADDTTMFLRDADLNQLEFDDDDGPGFFSLIDRTCGVDAMPAGTYFVEVDELGGDNEMLFYTLDLTETLCPCPADITLADQTLNGTQAHVASGTATLGPNLIVDGANISVEAPTVSIFPGTEITGTFSIGVNPTCP